MFNTLTRQGKQRQKSFVNTTVEKEDCHRPTPFMYNFKKLQEVKTANF